MNLAENKQNFFDMPQTVEENVEELVCQNSDLTPERMALEAILMTYEKFDKFLFEKHNTSKEYSCGFKSIYIKINGKSAKLTRRYYRDHQTKKYVFLLDEHLGLKSRKELSYELIIKHLKEIIMARSYKQASENVLHYLDPKLISDTIKKVTFAMRWKPLTDKVDTLYVALDGQGFGAKGKKGRKNEFKFAVFGTGTEKVSKKRNKLINRQILCLNKMKNTVEIAKRIELFIYEVYGAVKHVIVIGDGANGITNAARELTYKTTRVIDKYHFSKMLSQLFNSVKGSRFKGELPDVLNTSKEEFENCLLQQLINEEGEIEKGDEATRTLFNRIIKGYPKYKKNIKLLNAINPIECIQAHYFAKYFRGHRVFKLKNLYKYINLQCAYLNNGEIDFSVNSNSSWMGGDPEYKKGKEPDRDDGLSINYNTGESHGIKTTYMKVEYSEDYGFGGRH